MLLDDGRVRTDAGEGRSVSSLGGRAGCSVSYLVLNVLSRREPESLREHARACESGAVLPGRDD